ncbi:9332_t:CDS:2 [Dentiscutata erythropus]|uniref:9332_t:CDS:1 n=1 Tax=Dentiscutata erythropus TaxID=1348616 RepID=A0A9N9AWL0_9GLOM|nr:9332_t:CDS:2 [Dentiscutata erythropus]
MSGVTNEKCYSTSKSWRNAFTRISTVIALYPHTRFYKAVVVIPPGKLTPKTSRYLLTFEDDENAERYVDAHYVLDIIRER